MYNDFIIERSKVLPEVLIIKPDVFKDERGMLYTSMLSKSFDDFTNESLSFNHSKFATNKKGVLRGIHGDYKSWKLVSCVYGKIFQIVVDCRPDSENYLKYDKFTLDFNNPCLILMPPGFGNAFEVLSSEAVYNYQLSYSGLYNDHDKQFTYKWNDKRININWPIKDPILSNRDK